MARIVRRVGSTPAQRGSNSGANCPDVLELDNGDFLVIGKIRMEGLGGSIRASSFAGVRGVSVGPDEQAVIVPRQCLLDAARDLAKEA